MLKGNNWQSRILLLRKYNSRMKDKNKDFFLAEKQKKIHHQQTQETVKEEI